MAATDPAEIVLVKFLNELDDKSLGKFHWYMSKYKRGRSQPIQRSELVGTTREETVDKLVQVYGEEGAVKTTVCILKRMNCNDRAKRLIKALPYDDDDDEEEGSEEDEEDESEEDDEEE